MADVSKLRLDNVTYDIKDDNARKYLVMVNEEPVSATKMVVETGGDVIELALQSDLDNVIDRLDETNDALFDESAIREAQIASLQSSVGSPLVASTKAAMIDSTKIYVYTGSETGMVNGNWYYKSGTSWVSGGVYNSVAVETDKTLTVENKAADAKAVGDIIKPWMVSTKNLFERWIFGIELNGNTGAEIVHTGNITCCTDYIRISATTNYTLSCDSAMSVFSSARAYYYDSSKAFLGRRSLTISNNSGTMYSLASTVYVRLQISVGTGGNITQTMGNISNWQLELGSVPTYYVPHLSISDKVITYADDNLFQNHNVMNWLLQSKRRLNDVDNTTDHNAFLNHPLFPTFIHFSDLHLDSANLKRIIAFRDHYSNYISDVISTGDQVDYYTDDYSFWTDAKANKVLTIIGNHEGVYLEDGVVKRDTPQADLYTKYYAPFISTWDVTYDSYKCHWYKDYNECVRLIGINAWARFSSQADEDAEITWLSNVLANAITNNLTVAICEHFPGADSTSIAPISCNFTSLTGRLDATLRTTFMDTVATFINNGGKFACWICGHAHVDKIYHNSSYQNQLFVNVANASCEDLYSDFDRVRGKVSQDCFNLISIDPTTTTIKLCRVGANLDCMLRPRNTIVINYLTGEVISQA